MNKKLSWGWSSSLSGDSSENVYLLSVAWGEIEDTSKRAAGISKCLNPEIIVGL